MNQLLKGLTVVVSALVAFNPVLKETRKLVKKVEEEGVFSEEFMTKVSKPKEEVSTSKPVETDSEASSVTDTKPQATTNTEESKQENLVERLNSAIKKVAKVVGIIIDYVTAVVDCVANLSAGTTGQVA